MFWLLNGGHTHRHDAMIYCHSASVNDLDLVCFIHPIYHSLFSNDLFLWTVECTVVSENSESELEQATSDFCKKQSKVWKQYVSNNIFMGEIFMNVQIQNLLCVKLLFLRSLHEAVWSFKSWDWRAVWTWLLTWQSLKWAWFVCITLHGKRCGLSLIISPMLCLRKRWTRLWHCGDVVTFKSLTLTPFCLEKFSSRKGIFNARAMFSLQIRLKSGKICKINDHTCLFHCIKTCRVPRTLFEHRA